MDGNGVGRGVSMLWKGVTHSGVACVPGQVIESEAVEAGERGGEDAGGDVVAVARIEEDAVEDERGGGGGVESTERPVAEIHVERHCRGLC